MNNDLYFLAILFPEQISKEIVQLKSEIASITQSKHALKIPPHITIIPPFHCKQEDFNSILTLLDSVICKGKPFSTTCHNFGSFRKDVLFINCEPSNEAFRLRDELKVNLPNLFTRDYGAWHPHITLAFRDLSEAGFTKGKQYLETKNYHCEFQTHEITLLHQVNGMWQAHHSFKLNSVS